MTTDGAWRLLRGAALALGAWFGGMAGLALVVDPPGAIAFGPSASLARAVGATDAALLESGAGFVLLWDQAPGLPARLYANGAWFVWPALPKGCLRL
jgi:hypothetical protein